MKLEELVKTLLKEGLYGSGFGYDEECKLNYKFCE